MGIVASDAPAVQSMIASSISRTVYIHTDKYTMPFMMHSARASLPVFFHLLGKGEYYSMRRKKKVRVRKRGEERKTSFLTMPSNLELTSYVESPSASRTNSSA